MSEQGETPTKASEAGDQEAAKRRSFSLLASERFGSDFIGEVVPDAPADPPVTDDDPTKGEGEQVVDDDAADDDPEKGESENAVTDDDGGDTDTDPEKDDEVPISSVQELIEANEFDPEWFNSLKVPVKVDGKPAEATLADLVRSYQIEEAAKQRLEDAKSKVRTHNQEWTEKQEALQNQLAVVAKLIQNAETMLDQDSKTIDWAKLERDDPALFSAQRIKLAERQKQIDKLKSDALNEWQSLSQQQQEQQQTEFAKRQEAEQRKLREAIPELADEKKAPAYSKALATYLIGQGFTQEDIAYASDHRLFVMADKARRFDEIASKSDTARKKVRKVPKVMKPGAPKPKEQQNREKLDKLRARLRESGSIDDALQLMRASRGN